MRFSLTELDATQDAPISTSRDLSPEQRLEQLEEAASFILETPQRVGRV